MTIDEEVLGRIPESGGRYYGRPTRASREQPGAHHRLRRRRSGQGSDNYTELYAFFLNPALLLLCRDGLSAT